MGNIFLILVVSGLAVSLLTGFTVIFACMSSGRDPYQMSVQQPQQPRQLEMVELLEELQVANNPT